MVTGFLLRGKSVSFIFLRRTNLYFVDNFSFLTQTENAGQPPVRHGSLKNAGKTSAPVIAAGLVRQVHFFRLYQT